MDGFANKAAWLLLNLTPQAPTAIRALMRHGTEFVKKYDLSSLRVLGTVGEPINPEAWSKLHCESGVDGLAL